MKLVMGSRAYSSWSLRPWLLLKHAGIPFEEEVLSFNAPDFKARARSYSPVGKVPVLVDGDLVIWDSLAICEYVAERFPEKGLWPKEQRARARARSVCAEMHSGFQALRQNMPMNVTAHLPGRGWNLTVQRDIDRVTSLWADCRARFGAGGPFLFGAFSVADAYFAPVVTRFTTYGVALPDDARAYVDTITALPAMKAWVEAARADRDYVEEDEPYRTREQAGLGS
ncbi:MAG: glutathione S-transferase family protein [Myxococcota bacterium]